MSDDKIKQQLVTSISDAIAERFIVVSESDEIDTLKGLAPETLKDFDVLRIQRRSTGTTGWRTFIITYLNSAKEIDIALEWSAYCKEELLDPESADLYLLIIITKPDITIEECVNIEASEKFCRKFILRPGEEINDLLKRTFLLPIEDQAVSGNILDPLTIALTNTAKNSPWLNSDELQRWRNILLSSANGHDLIELIFNYPEDERTEHEIPGENND